MKTLEACYDNGVFRPTENLPLRSGERVNLIVIRKPDSDRWNLAKLSSQTSEDSALSQLGLADWSNDLDNEDRD